MADLMSRIVFQAQGGDQVAREVGKIKRAYKEAGDESERISGGTGGRGPSFDAFQKATQTSAGTDMGSRRVANEEYRNRLNDRLSRHGQVGGQVGPWGGGAPSVGAAYGIQQFGGAATQMMAGDPMGGAMRGVGMLGKAGPAGIVAAVALALGAGTQALAKKEEDRMVQIGHGLMQSLGQTQWGDMRNFLNEMRNNAVPEEFILPYLQSMRSAGAMAPSNFLEVGLMAGNEMLARGIDPTTLGTFQAARQKAGLGTLNADQLALDLYRGEAGFGTAGLNKFLGAISTAIEGAMSRGMRRGAIGRDVEYDSFTRLLSGLGVVGGMSIEGAVQTFNQVQQSIAASQNMARPQDAFQFMMFRQAGDTYGQTIRRMSRPGADTQRYKNLKAMAGGSRELLEILIQQEYGLDWQALDPFIQTMENQIAPTRTGFEGGAGAVDSEIVETMQRTQRQWGERIQRGANKVLNNLFGFLTGEGGLTPVDVRERAGLAGIYGGMTGRERRGGAYADLLGLSGDAELISALPPELQVFGAMVQGVESRTGPTTVGRDLLANLALYQRFQSGGPMSDAERAMMEEYAPAFGLLMEQLSDPNIQEAILSGNNITRFGEIITDVDRENNDNLKNLVTIVDLLIAMERYFEGDTVTDEGATE